ncbi:DUF1828 domain-containing protein [Companilactobacillus sp. HBUAS56275]|uniref:DUF1828 domain-containing protein n=1 Tax=Candidatus Companilactobacillus pullicola TaxID=2838523 RepID=A0A9D1ZKX1_9LACO|nr:DUF1828 domain-containing protein [Candidatus Companilactobacillus pullicola]
MNAKEMQKTSLEWLRNNEKYTDMASNTVKIETSLLDNSLDTIIIYAETNDSKITLTDDGWTLDNLESHGFDFSKDSYLFNSLHAILKVFKITLIDDELSISCNKHDFPTTKQNFLQGIIAINNLGLLTNLQN